LLTHVLILFTLGCMRAIPVETFASWHVAVVDTPDVVDHVKVVFSEGQG